MEVPVLIVDPLRLACEEAALSHGLNVPIIKIVAHQDMQISSDGQTLYLASGLADLPSAPRFALISFSLYFHTALSANQRMQYRAPRGLGQRFIELIVGLRSAPLKLEQPPGRHAREAAKASYKGNHSALLQALLMSRIGLQVSDPAFAGERLFDDSEDISEFAQQLEGFIEGDFSDQRDDLLPLPNKLLKIAHKTSTLLEIGDRNTPHQVASLNRLYQSIGPVGTVAYVIKRVSSTVLSDADRLQVMVELLTSVLPLQVRLQLVDFAASKLLVLNDMQKLSFISLLRETLSSLANFEEKDASVEPTGVTLGESPILTWTFLSVLRSKLNLKESVEAKQKPLADKDKRRCIAELFYVAAELGGEGSSISARALRDQVDAVCEALEIDRPVSSPDEFQAAAWLEALDELDRFSLHETLCILDALSLWGQNDSTYQTWLDAICQRLRVQRQLASALKPKPLRESNAPLVEWLPDQSTLQYGDGQPKALQAEK